MDRSSERCLRLIKRRHSDDHSADHLSKASRLSIPSLFSDTHLLNPEAPKATDYDFSHFTVQSNVLQLTLQSDASIGLYSQAEIISKPVDSDFNIRQINRRIPDVTIPEPEKRSLNVLNIADSSVVAQNSKESLDQINTSRTFPSKQTFYSNSHATSNDRGCPDCAAGQSGHIRHIGRWRLMDSA